MPAVAQISVNFAQLSQIRSNASTAPTNVRVVSPRTLTQYLLNNREQGDTVLSSPAYLNYSGGFISAGNKVNVKHDSDLQLRQNLDVEQSVFADSIHARRKGNTADTYKDSRSSSVLRSITLAPYENDLNANIISITTTPSTKNISLFMNFGNQGENSITLNNTNNDKKLNVRTGDFRIDAADLDIYGAPVYIDETVEINKETTITDNLNVTGNLSLGTTSYNKFTIESASGNVAFTGNLTINTDKFTVASATGNTVIAGTLNVSGNTSIGGTTTLSNSITIGTGDNTSATRRIIGVRRLNGISDYIGSSYNNDAITVGDVKLFGFKKGMIMMWSPIDPDNYADNFTPAGASAGLGIGNMTGWAVCNGLNNTVNLINSFIIGGRVLDGQTTITGTATTTGGTKDAVVVNHNHTGSVGGDGSHTHTATDAGHTHPITTKKDFAPQSGSATPCWARQQEANTGLGYANITVSGAGTHAHTVTIDNAGESGTNKNLPPYYSLIYIMKIT